MSCELAKLDEIRCRIWLCAFVAGVDIEKRRNMGGVGPKGEYFEVGDCLCGNGSEI